MSQNAKPPVSCDLVVRNSRTGQLVTVRGAGALKGSGFAIRDGIDLTKPIAQQAATAAPKRSAAR